jgi:predicted Zn-ribbon and HTH transcriptional regulator
MCTEVVSGERRTTKWERKSFQEVFVEHRRSVERTTRRNEMSEGREGAECAKCGWVGKDKVRTSTLIEEEERQERNEKDGKVQNRKKRVILPERFWGSLWNVDAVGGDRSPTAQERGGNLIYGQQQTL